MFGTVEPMFGNGQDDIQSVKFSSSRHIDLPVEVLEYAGLFERQGKTDFQRAQRPTFGLVIMVRTGRGRHIVDFEDVELIRLFSTK